MTEINSLLKEPIPKRTYSLLLSIKVLKNSPTNISHLNFYSLWSDESQLKHKIFRFLVYMSQNIYPYSQWWKISTWRGLLKSFYSVIAWAACSLIFPIMLHGLERSLDENFRLTDQPDEQGCMRWVLPTHQRQA